MKQYFLIAIALVAILWSACNESPYINAPGDNRFNNEDIAVLKLDTNGIVSSVTEAYEFGMTLAPGAKTTEQYKITGTFSSPQLDKQQLNFYLTDGTNKIKCQYTKNINGTPFTNQSQVPEDGSIVTVQGPLTKYSGNSGIEIEIYEGFIVRVDKKV